MRLSEWRRRAPARDSLEAPVLDVLRPVLADFGADPDPECWVAWGDDPETRYSILLPVAAGLVTIAVRTPAGGEEARATANLVRWPKLTLGDFSLDAAAGRRVVVVQVESHILKGVDTEADRICEFMRGLVLAADGRGPLAAAPAAQAIPAGPSAAEIGRAVADALKRVVIPLAAAQAGARAGASGGVTAPGAGAAKARASAPARPRKREAPEEIALRPAAARTALRPKAANRDRPPEDAVIELGPGSGTGPAESVAALAAEPQAEITAEEEILLTAEPLPGEPLPAETGLALLAAEEGAGPMETAAEAEAEFEEAADSEGEARTSAQAPRRPRAPRKPRAEGDEPKPARPRRVHREWPQPAGQPGWIDAHPIEETRTKKRPRWIP